MPIDDEARRETIADALRPVMHDGEAYQVICQDAEVWVTESDSSVYALKYPRLYGRLLSLSAAMHATVGRLPNYTMMLTAGVCVGLHLHWWDTVLGEQAVAKLSSAWFYVFLFFVVIGLLHQLSGQLQWRVYCRRRHEIFDLMKLEQIDRDTLIAQLDGDANVARVMNLLKIDPEADARFAHLPEHSEAQ